MLNERKGRKILMILMILLMLIFVLTGCSNESKEEDDDEETPLTSIENRLDYSGKGSESKKDKSETSVTGYEECINNLFKGLENGNLKTYQKAFPDFYNKFSEVDNDDMKEMYDSLKDEYGEDFKVTYKVTKEENVEKDDLNKIQKCIKKVFEEDINITDGKKIKVETVIKGSKKEDTESSTMYVYKIDGEWKYFVISPEIAENYL